MKNIYLLTFLSTMTFALSASILPTPQEIDVFPKGTAEKLVYSTGFENPDAPEFQIVYPEVSFVRGAGCNGNTALKLEGDNNTMFYVNLKDVCQEGMKYQAKVFVRGQTSSTDGQQHGSYRFISVNFKDNQTEKEQDWRQYGVFPFTSYLSDPDDINAFKEFTFTFYGHANLFPFFRFSVGAGGPYQGTIYFDDFRVYQCGVDAHINLVAPAMSAFKQGDRSFRFYAAAPGIDALALSVRLLQNGETKWETTLAADAEGFFCGELDAALPAGEYAFQTILADLQEKRQLKEATFPVSIRPADEVPPVGAVSFDSRRRLLVDGKPFFAVSMGCGEAFSAEHLKRHADEGYNVIDTGPFNLVVYTEPNHLEKLLEKLDYLHSLGLKVRLSLIDFYNRHYLCQFYGTGTEGATKLVNGLKNHPAILGYYLLDELTEKDWPMVTEFRNAANLADPYHPCYICTNLLSTTPKIAVTTDVIGYDYYPIGLKGQQIETMNNVETMARQTRETGLPFWAVPQAFNWALYQPDLTPEAFQRYRQPTVNQVFADGVLFALNGAVDFWFYNCQIGTYYKERIGKLGALDYPDAMFSTAGEAIRHFQKLAPYLTSQYLPEEIALQAKSAGKLQAMLFRKDDGKAAVVVLGGGAEDLEARLELPADKEWTSDFGMLTTDGTGAWRFSAHFLGADVLYEK